MKFITDQKPDKIKVLKGNYKVGHIRKLGKEYLFFPFAHSGALSCYQLQVITGKLIELNKGNKRR